MNEKQRLIEVRDQFALKNASDDTLRKILPSYRQAIDNIRTQLEFLPEGNIERELWLKTQLKTMERQFQQVASRIDDVLPPAQADQFLRALHNAKEYLEADGIKPAAAQQTALSGTTASGQTVTQTGNLPSVAGNDGFIQPSITRQQIEAASRTGGFSTFTLDDQVIKLEDVLPKWQKAQVANLERTLRTGFLLGETNEEIMRKFGPLGPGRKGWAMTEAVVRTGMAEASQAAHDAFFDANEDLLPKVPGGYRWEWDASNDTRLCPLCAPLDGMRYKTRAEMPAKPHWGCRCKKLPITATQAALRERGDVPEGSFLERKEVTYTNGKRNPAPAGYESVKRGGTAYARPQKIDGKMYWVRRRELPKGQTLAGDMIKRMDDDNKLAILGTKKNVQEWNKRIKLDAYKDDPQKLVRDLLGKGGSGPARPPLPPKPPGSGPKPRPKKPAPQRRVKARTVQSKREGPPTVDVSQMRRAAPGGEYGPDGHFYPGGSFMPDGNFVGQKQPLGTGDRPAIKAADQVKPADVEPRVVRQRENKSPRPYVPSSATGLEAPANKLSKLQQRRQTEFFDKQGFLSEDIAIAARKAGPDGRSPIDNTNFISVLANRADRNWLESKIKDIRRVITDKSAFDYAMEDSDFISQMEFAGLTRGMSAVDEGHWAAARRLQQAVFELAGQRVAKKKGSRRARHHNEEMIWIMNNVFMTKRRG